MTDPEASNFDDALATLLQSGDKEAFSRFRQDNPHAPILLRRADLKNADLSDLNLTGADLREAELGAANLSGSILRNAKLCDSVLVGAVLTSTDATGASFAGAFLDNARFQGATLTKCKFDRARMLDASFRGVTALGISLRGADLTEADLSSANISHSDLTHARLRHAKLRDVEAAGACFVSASLIGSDCSGSDFRAASFVDAHLAHAKCTYSNYSSADLSRVDLECASLQAANLDGSNLSGATLTGTDIRSASFHGAIVDGVTSLQDSRSQGDAVRLRYDVDTRFDSVGLGNARIDAGTKADLEYNIRRAYWSRPHRPGIASHLAFRVSNVFWKATDYGRSTSRIVATFFLTSLAYSFIYLIGIMPAPAWYPEWAICEPLVQHLGSCPSPTGTIDLTEAPFILWSRSMYFSIVTMTTLGFGDVTANPVNPWGYLAVGGQVLLGYTVLGCMITRLAILFQSVR